MEPTEECRRSTKEGRATASGSGGEVRERPCRHDALLSEQTSVEVFDIRNEALGREPFRDSGSGGLADAPRALPVAHEALDCRRESGRVVAGHEIPSFVFVD